MAPPLLQMAPRATVHLLVAAYHRRRPLDAAQATPAFRPLVLPPLRLSTEGGRARGAGEAGHRLRVAAAQAPCHRCCPD
jgi:hypothetical protein